MSLIRSALVAALMFASSAASAATFNITFFESRLPFGVDPATFDYQNDGIADGFGTFTSDDVGNALVTSFSANLLGAIYNDLTDTGLALRLVLGFGNPGDIYVDGTVLKPGELPGPTTQVLQMDAIGLGFSNGPIRYFGAWGFSPCTGSGCGGGTYRGVYTIERAAVVPLPAGALLLPVGLGAFVFIGRKRRAMARAA